MTDWTLLPKHRGYEEREREREQRTKRTSFDRFLGFLGVIQLAVLDEILRYRLPSIFRRWPKAQFQLCGFVRDYRDRRSIWCLWNTSFMVSVLLKYISINKTHSTSVTELFVNLHSSKKNSKHIYHFYQWSMKNKKKNINIQVGSTLSTHLVAFIGKNSVKNFGREGGGGWKRRSGKESSSVAITLPVKLTSPLHCCTQQARMLYMLGNKI